MEIQPGDVISTYADTSLLEKDFSYKPLHQSKSASVNFTNGLRNLSVLNHFYLLRQCLNVQYSIFMNVNPL